MIGSNHPQRLALNEAIEALCELQNRITPHFRALQEELALLSQQQQHESGDTYLLATPGEGNKSHESDGVASPDDDPRNWEECFDPIYGVPYYFNHVTRHTQWDKPPGFVQDPGVDLGSSGHPGDVPAERQNESARTDPDAYPSYELLKRGEWYELLDRASGVLYYENEETGYTQWEPPEEFQDDGKLISSLFVAGGFSRLRL